MAYKKAPVRYRDMLADPVDLAGAPFDVVFGEHLKVCKHSVHR